MEKEMGEELGEREVLFATMPGGESKIVIALS